MPLALARLPEDDAPGSAWLHISKAAPLLGVVPGQLRRTCAERYGPSQLAEQRGGTWFISPRADERLRGELDLIARDREVIAGLSKDAVPQRSIDKAIAKRDVVLAFRAYDCRGLDQQEARASFIASSAISGVFRELGLRSPSVRTLYNWESRYRDDGIRGLVRRTAESKATQVSGGAALDFIVNLVTCGNRISLRQAITMAHGEAAKHPGDPAWLIGSYSTIRLAVAPRLPKILRVLAGKGERTAIATCIPKRPRDYEAVPSNAEWIGDERTLDVQIRYRTARGWRHTREVKITAWMDARSRIIVGWIVDIYADSNTILGSLRLGIDKWGKPNLLRVDWGKDYKKATGSRHHRRWKCREFDGKRINSVLDQLDINVSAAMPYTPWAKAIESFFSTMRENLDKMFASFWGGCPSERHEDRVKWIKKNLEKLPTLDDLREAIVKYLDIYHHTPHGAEDMFGKSPLEAMEAFRQGEVPRRESDAVLDHLFRSYVGPKLVRRDGIRQYNHWYGHGDARLITLQGQKVLLAMQPHDASRAVVCEVNDDHTPLFEIECLLLRGYTVRDAADIAQQNARIMRPFRQQATAASRKFRTQAPTDRLDMLADGVRAQHGSGEPEETTAPALRIRPALEAAIDNAAGAPSDTVEARAMRTGTDDDEITLDDLLGDDAEYAQSLRPARREADDDVDFFGLDDPGGDA